MQFRTLATLLASLVILGSVQAVPVADDLICEGEKVLSETYVGKDKNVKLEHISCAETASLQPRSNGLLEGRQANVCGATCATNCFTPSGGGPDPNECNVIADALRFESQNTGPLFQVGTGTNNTISMTYRSCRSFFLNQDLAAVTYCRLDWASLIDFVALNCQAAQNAHGGNCVATDQRWFAQVQHS